MTMTFELWQSPDQETHYFPRDEEHRERLIELPTGSRLIWTFEARRLSEAMQARDNYLDVTEWNVGDDFEDVYYD